MKSSYDVVVVGAGLVGLATAYRLQQCRPGLRMAVLDKEATVGVHQSGHNSGVLHAGMYYAPGSLKAELCVRGKRELEAFAATHSIPVQRCGKLIVASDNSELARLQTLHERGSANGVEGSGRSAQMRCGTTSRTSSGSGHCTSPAPASSTSPPWPPRLRRR